MYSIPVNSHESDTTRYKTMCLRCKPPSFAMILLGEINALIVKLETGLRLQSDIDHIYSDFCTFIKGRFHVVK